MTLSGFPGPIRFDRFTLSPEQRSLTSGGAPVALSSRAYDILVLLLKRQNQVVSKDEILSEVWAGTIVEESNLPVQLSGLRRALGERSDGGPFILTVQGRGYRFICPITRADSHRDNRSCEPVAWTAIMRARLPRITLVARLPANPDACATVLLSALQDDLLLALGRSRTMWIAAPGPSDPMETDYTVETSLRPAGRRVFLTLKLIHRSTARQMLAERIEVDAQERAIAAEAVRLAFAIEHALTIAPQDDVAPDAHALFVSGYKLHQTFRLDHIDAAEALFRQSASIDPHYARPIAALASVELTRPMVSPSDRPIEPFVERGLALARRAVQVDPWDPWAHIMLAWALTRQRRPRIAIQEFERALALHPDNPVVIMSVAEGFAVLGQPERGVSLGERAIKLHPAPPDYFFSYLATAYAAAGAQAKALECLETLDPVVPEDFALRALCLARESRHTEARATAATLLDAVRGRWTGLIRPDHNAVLDWLLRVNLVADEQKRADVVRQLACLY